MDKVFRENLTPKGPDAHAAGVAQDPGLQPIRHKEFNEFIKG